MKKSMSVNEKSIKKNIVWFLKSMVKTLESKKDSQAAWRPLCRAHIWTWSEGMNMWSYDRTVSQGEGVKSTKVMR